MYPNIIWCLNHLAVIPSCAACPIGHTLAQSIKQPSPQEDAWEREVDCPPASAQAGPPQKKVLEGQGMMLQGIKVFHFCLKQKICTIKSDFVMKKT